MTNESTAMAPMATIKPLAVSVVRLEEFIKGVV
jgi:hypothetical protein